MSHDSVQIDWQRVADQAVALQNALAAGDGMQQRALVADAVVEFGPAFLDTLELFARTPALASAVGLVGNPSLSAVQDRARGLLAAWIVGERITARADEGERRVLAARELLARDTDDTYLARLVAVAILRLPEGHPGRDVDFAGTALRRHLEQSRREHDEDEQTISVYYLLKHELEPPARAAELIDEIHKLLARREPKLRRDFLRAAHDYSIVQAGDALGRGRHEEHRAWLRRAELLLAEALASGVPELSMATMRAWQLDISGRELEAAQAYAALVDAGDPEDAAVQVAVVSEATVRSLTGQYELVRDRLAPFLPLLTERYLTAAGDEDVEDGARLLGRAANLLAFAHAWLGDWEAALRAIDHAKSLRLRYRGALSDHPARAHVLGLERAIRVAPSGYRLGTVQLGADISASLPLRARLLEQYRRTRPELPAALLESPSVEDIATALHPGEAAVLLGVGVDATMLGLMFPGDGASRDGRLILLDDWPASRWEGLMGTSGWIDALAHTPGSDGRMSLNAIIAGAEDAIGRRVVELIEGHEITRLALVPHRWLHLVPWWATPSFADYGVSVFASAAELVRARQRAAERSGGSWVVAADPTGDLWISPSEVESVARVAGSAIRTNRPGEATIEWLASKLSDASFFHFSGHGLSDPADPDRCALLVSPPAGRPDPFPEWAAAVTEWQDLGDGKRVGDVDRIGRLWERSMPRTGGLERRMEQPDGGSWYAYYEDGCRLRLGQLWTAGDIRAATSIQSEFAFLSACESGLAGQVTDVDEFGGLSTALQLAGVRTVVCSLWVVSEEFAAINVDLFYDELSTTPPPVDVLATVRRVQTRLRLMERGEVLVRLDLLADAVREHNPRAAMALEARRRRIQSDTQRHPFGDPWEWASFYAVGEGTIDIPSGGPSCSRA